MKTYRPYAPAQPYLLPPSPTEWLPEVHLAYFVIEVVEALDLADIERVLQLCRSVGLVKLGLVALDGSKLKANASKHKAMSYQRMKQADARLSGEIEGLLRRADEADATEDARFGVG